MLASLRRRTVAPAAGRLDPDPSAGSELGAEPPPDGRYAVGGDQGLPPGRTGAPAGEVGLLHIGSSAVLFMSAMIFDGVFERHPHLRMISMEHAASWLPSWLHQLDFTAHMFKRRREFAEAPSETAKRHIKVSPFPDEPVGWIIDNVGPDMLCFASDYPHPEGSRDPIGKFERSMPGCDQATMDKFYHGNMLELMNVA